MRRLDGLLHCILCSGRRACIPLYGRISFVHGCVRLVHVQLSSGMGVAARFSVRPSDRALVTPLVFVSLVRGTFGRNVSPARADFVDVHVSRDGGRMVYRVHGDGRPGAVRSGDNSNIKLRRIDQQLRVLCPKSCA